MKALKALAKLWTWKHVDDLKAADGMAAFAAYRTVETVGKAVLGAAGLTGDPVGQTAQEDLEGAAGIGAEEVDDGLAGNRNPSTFPREELGIVNLSGNDWRTVEPRYWDSAFG
jgi:hypothetical protein